MVERLDAFELIEKIRRVAPNEDRLARVAISGFAGAGKSTLAAIVNRALEGSEIVPIDDFIFGPRQQRSIDWATFDRERLKREVLEVAKPREQLSYRCYNSDEWVNGKAGRIKTITPAIVLIIEGCGILHPDLMSYYDYSAWIDCPAGKALDRAKVRDRSEGNDNDRLWEEVWAPNDQDYYNKFQPNQLASALVKSF